MPLLLQAQNDFQLIARQTVQFIMPEVVLTLFVSLELMAVSVYILVGFLKRDKKSNEAAMKYFLLGAFSSGVLLFGISLVYGLTGTTNLAGIAKALPIVTSSGFNPFGVEQSVAPDMRY